MNQQLFESWRDHTIGAVVRGQIVCHVALTIDTFTNERGETRVILFVMFKQPKNENVRIPFGATSGPITWREAQMVMVGNAEANWTLNDESQSTVGFVPGKPE